MGKILSISKYLNEEDKNDIEEHNNIDIDIEKENNISIKESKLISKNFNKDITFVITKHKKKQIEDDLDLIEIIDIS